MVTFIKDIDAVTGRGQYHTASQREVRKHQIVVGYNDICGFEITAGAEKGTSAKMTTTAVSALTMIDGQPPPVVVIDSPRPAFAISLPVATAVGIGQLLYQRLEMASSVLVQALLKQRQGGIAFNTIQGLLKPCQADIAPAPLGQCITEIEPAMRFEGRQILQQHLFLQGDGGRSNYQSLASRLGHRQSR